MKGIFILEKNCQITTMAQSQCRKPNNDFLTLEFNQALFFQVKKLKTTKLMRVLKANVQK